MCVGEFIYYYLITTMITIIIGNNSSLSFNDTYMVGVYTMLISYLYYLRMSFVLPWINVQLWRLLSKLTRMILVIRVCVCVCTCTKVCMCARKCVCISAFMCMSETIVDEDLFSYSTAFCYISSEWALFSRQYMIYWCHVRTYIWYGMHAY